ncbi:MAG TPA: adenylate/guanylate cyclase domain-containing protein [Solimonas sp.]|nr:adenylate/guanylate cyclase domain-containing protein [Solimonas sp.]
MTADRDWRAVLFADLVGSTAAYEKLGDASAKAAVEKHLRAMMKVVHAHRGEVVKTMGDAVLACFRSADEAARTAIQMQNELRVTQPSDASFNVRVGFHFGEVIYEATDVFGDAVNTGARLTEAARGGQILTSEATVAKLSPDLKAKTRAFDTFRFKGKAQEMGVHEVLWETQDELTRVGTRAAGPAADGRSYTRLRVKVGVRETVVVPERTPATIGRDATCAVVVLAGLASRIHAKIEYQRGKFVLADHSTNGTYVTGEDGREVFLRRETMPLVGRGIISLGCPLLEQTSEPVKYACE